MILGKRPNQRRRHVWTKNSSPHGKPIVNQTSQTAIYNTTGKIQVTFPTKGIYQIVISIDGLAPIDSDTLDTSRNSIARGYLLVE